MERQLDRLSRYATEHGLTVGVMAKEVGSAMNGHRPKLLKILHDPKIGILVVEHRDRLIRFGFESVEAALAATGRKVLVVEETEVADDLVRDMTEVLTSFCARLYSRRSARHRAASAVAHIHSIREEEVR